MLVFLLWTVIIIITLILIISFIIFFSNIRIEIEELKINYKDRGENNKIEFSIIIKTYLFNFIKISNIKINKEKIEKCLKQLERINIYEKILKNKKFDKKVIHTAQDYVKKYKNEYNKSPISFKQMDLNLEIGLINIETTAKIASFLSIILAIPLPFLEDAYYKYNIISKHDENSIININLSLESIIEMNLKHIIIILVKMMIGRVKEDARTSNRRFNEYSYEQH